MAKTSREHRPDEGGRAARHGGLALLLLALLASCVPLATTPGPAPFATVASGVTTATATVAVPTVAPSPTQVNGEPEAPATAAPTDAPETSGAAMPTSYLDPAGFDAFVEQAHLDQIARNPELVTEYGLSEALGMDNSQLTDLSDANQLETYALYEAQWETLRQFDRAALSPDQQVTYDLFSYDLDTFIAGKAYRFHDHPVRQVLGVHTQLLELMTDRQPMRSQKDAEDYIARLAAFPTKIDQLLSWLTAQREMGIVMPAFAIRNVVWQLDQFLGLRPERTEVYTVFVEKLGNIAGIDADTRATLRERALVAVTDRAQPAYRDLKAHFQELLAGAPEEGGLSRLPDGGAAYAYTLALHTTTNLTADEIHELGLQEVARIQAEMDAKMDELGIAEGGLPDRIGQVAQRGGAVPSSRILSTYRDLIEEASQRLTPWFESVPKADVVVTELDYPGAAYYVSPALDGSRPGTFYAGVGAQAWRFSMPTLAYHEAIPGHHLQLALAQELEHLPGFRRIGGYTAYAEGWALYAERLAWEAGWYKGDPYGNIGRLQDELFRAARLVIDTGIHAKGWTRQQAIDYMVDAVGRPVGASTGEVERYILWPGQATAYKVGMLQLLELRAAAEEALGDDFDIRAFHSCVLMEGSLPLPLLEDQVLAWIDEG